MSEIHKALIAARSVGWQVVHDFPEYLVGDSGEIVSTKNGSVSFLRGTKCGIGYRAVTLRHNGQERREYIHRLVAEHWIEPVEGATCVRHLDGNMHNNSIENLAYGTARENAQDQVKHKKSRRGAAHHNAKLSQEYVNEIRGRASNGESQASLSKEFCVSPMTISRIVRYESWREYE